MEKTDTKPFGSDSDYFIACAYCNNRVEEGKEPNRTYLFEPYEICCEKCGEIYIVIYADPKFTTVKRP